MMAAPIASASPTPHGLQCMCRACGLVFNSERPFARHFTGEYEPNARRCLTVPELEARGYVQNARGAWQFATRAFGKGQSSPPARKRLFGHTLQATSSVYAPSEAAA
jgi:hypothetical protein